MRKPSLRIRTATATASVELASTGVPASTGWTVGLALSLMVAGALSLLIGRKPKRGAHK
jgi:LPXTG-motif cell wall-anchored protein